MTRSELLSIKIPVGWLCPFCGTVYSPGTTSCSKCVVEDDPIPETVDAELVDDFTSSPPYDA